jgi:hypothetical protein
VLSQLICGKHVANELLRRNCGVHKKKWRRTGSVARLVERIGDRPINSATGLAPVVPTRGMADEQFLYSVAPVGALGTFTGPSLIVWLFTAPTAYTA